jgi:hypothetical protein
MMARSVRKNGTAVWGEWKLEGEANRSKEKKNGRRKEGEIRQSRPELRGGQKCEEIANGVRNEIGMFLL